MVVTGRRDSGEMSPCDECSSRRETIFNTDHSNVRNFFVPLPQLGASATRLEQSGPP